MQKAPWWERLKPLWEEDPKARQFSQRVKIEDEWLKLFQRQMPDVPKVEIGFHDGGDWAAHLLPGGVAVVYYVDHVAICEVKDWWGEETHQGDGEDGLFVDDEPGVDPDPINLTPEQTQALQKAMDLLEQPGTVMTLVGPAGVGKTTLLRSLLRYAQTGTVLGAPTGKAAARLRQVAGKWASTIHRLLYGEVEQDLETGAPIFSQPHAPCGADDLLIIDEASMVGSKLYKELMEHVPPSACVLFVGDREQLSPVNDTWGPDFDNPTIVLTEVHRQAAGHPVIQYATAIREGRGNEWADNYDYKDARFKVADGFKEVFDWVEFLHSIDEEHILLTYTHRTRMYANDGVRERLWGMGAGVPKDPIVVGDKLVIRANNPHVGLMNGETVTVLSRETFLNRFDHAECVKVKVKESPIDLCINLALLEQDSGEFWKWKKGNARGNQWVHAHQGQCLTVHSSQGSQWKNVGFLWDKAFDKLRSDRPEEARRLLYTAVTRTIENLVIFFV